MVLNRLARHDWIVDTLSHSFSLQEEIILEWFKSKECEEVFEEFLPAERGAALFFTELNDAGKAELCCFTSPPKKFNGKCVYFIKNKKSKNIMKARSDAQVLFGELDRPNILNSMEKSISHIYEQWLHKTSDWGGEQERRDFLKSTQTFSDFLQRQIANIDAKIETKLPKQILTEEDVTRFDHILEDEKQREIYFKAVRRWIENIDTFIKSETCSQKLEAVPTVSEGPREEINRWERRQMALLKCTDRLSTPSFMMILRLVEQHYSERKVRSENTTTTPNSRRSPPVSPTSRRRSNKRLGTASSDEKKETTVHLWEQWTKCHDRLTDALNEAVDNVRFLDHLRPFVEPFYFEDCRAMTDALPPLFTSVKMILTISRHYSSRARMTKLLMKITFQLVRRCKQLILDGGSVNELWTQKSETIISRISECKALFRAYQNAYRATSEKLSTLPKRQQLNIDPEHVFGQAELFVCRLDKLTDIFSSVHQFQLLQSQYIDGLQDIIKEFDKEVEKLRSKKHDLLNYKHTGFERDYIEFVQTRSAMENAIQKFIDQVFSSVYSNNISAMLDLLNKLKLILHREALQDQLNAKYMSLFKLYGKQLEQVQRKYEAFRSEPPVARNMTRVAGAIQWARQLLRRISEPMEKFKQNQKVFVPKESLKIIKLYNNITRTLAEFEVLYYEAWIRLCDKQKNALQARLIVENEKNGQIFANFDRRLFELFREAKFLLKIGKDIPESARIILLLEPRLKGYFAKIHGICGRYNDMQKSLSPVLKTVLAPHFAHLKKVLWKGMVALTWTSMTIDEFVDDVNTGITNLASLINQCDDIIENRIKKCLTFINKTELVNIPDSRQFELHQFVAFQKNAIEKTSQILQQKNDEVFLAVKDLCENIQAFPRQDRDVEVKDTDFGKVFYFYQSLLYHSMLTAVKASLTTLRDRCHSRRTNIFLLDAGLFKMKLLLQVPDVKVSPNLDSVQNSVNDVAKMVIHASKDVFDWGWSEDGSQRDQITYFYTLSQDKSIIVTVLLLTGSMEITRKEIKSTLKNYNQFSWLWTNNPEDAYKKFLASHADPQLSDFVEELQKVIQVEEDIGKIADVDTLGAFQLSTENLKMQLQYECQRWKYQFSEKLHEEVRADLDDRFSAIQTLHSRLKRDVLDFTALKQTIDALGQVRDMESWIEMDFLSIFSRYEALEKYLPKESMSKIEMDNKLNIRSQWENLVAQAQDVRDRVNAKEDEVRQQLLKGVKKFKDDVDVFVEHYDTDGPMVEGITPQEAMTRLNKVSREFDTIARNKITFNSGLRLFGLPPDEYPRVEVISKDMELMTQLYGLYGDVLNTFDEYKNITWSNMFASMEEMEKKVRIYEMRLKQLPKEIRVWTQYQDLSTLISDFLGNLPILTELSKESMRQRHWDKISELCGTQFDVSKFDDLKLETVLDANLLEHEEDVLEITDGADKQLRLKHELETIGEQWAATDLEFSCFKNRGEVILKGDVVNDIIEKLEESQANLNQMLTMRHIAPFRTETEEQLRTLSDVNDMLESWVKLQQLWMSLEAVFSAGDIARQMPQDTKRFNKVDKEWASRFMTKAKEIKNVVGCCENDYMVAQLKDMFQSLEECQKSLQGYLEQKRNTFPRFYFVSDPALLLILSQGSDKKAVQSCFSKVFDAVSAVTFDKENITHILNRKAGYNGAMDEEAVRLSRQVNTSGNIEDWLGVLLKEMKRAMRREIKRVVSDLDKGFGFEEIIPNHRAQMSLLAVQFLWTRQVEEGLRNLKKNKLALQEVIEKQNKILMYLSESTTKEIDKKMMRRNIETLVTIQVHQNDVLDHIAERAQKRLVKNVDDFEWQKQLRCYWDYEERNCNVKVCDVTINYCWEYLGCKERLCVTPLTDRCYITLTQACNMIFGGAPAGPAGTGKTETVKDLGRALGKYVVVFNCSDQMRCKDTAKLYKGLCQSGSWGCFDEFNRIELEVLSVVAQQVMAILDCIRANRTTFYFPGDTQEVTLKPQCGFFITMNPGYAGRQELPENLKAQFRSVAMMVPDAEIIIKVKLASVGCFSFEHLSKKFFTLYQLCQEQLSKQRHYDFGLRNILSVLRTCGKNLRRELKKGNTGPRNNLEEMLLMRTLRDMNLSKLVGDDVMLFGSLLTDLFPNQKEPEKACYEDVEAAIDEIIERRPEIIKHEAWVSKIIQLYETSLVRHGLMMIGPAGGGKTSATSVLLDALSIVIKRKHVEVRMNPKSIRSQEMFGENDLVSGEWTDGIFSAIWSKYNDVNRNQVTWIVCDGPVDTVWIESLNTVLDDNKLLTLANGDRIPMTDNVRILFEAENLRNASPATVSRAGIIFVDTCDLGYKPKIKAWLKKFPSKIGKMIQNLYEKYIKKVNLFEWMRKKTTFVFPSEFDTLLMNCAKLFESLLPSEDADIDNVDEVFEKLWVYAMIWSVGGLYERPNMIKMHEKIFEINEGKLMPKCKKNETLYEYFVDVENDYKWTVWKAPQWTYPEAFSFSDCLIPTQDSVRAEYLLTILNGKNSFPCLVLGSSGTGKTSTVKQYFLSQEDDMIQKTVSFSSATTCRMFQDNVETDIEKRQGKTFAPPGGKKMTVFLDNISMPEINVWGDQPTLEIVRQLIEYDGFFFLEKDKRGDFKRVEGLYYVGAMNHPGGGRNDIPGRLKRHFFTFNLTPPSSTAIDNIYGQMLRGRLGHHEELKDTIGKVTGATIEIWLELKKRMLPTPSKFHYIFNMFDLARVFQGIAQMNVETLSSEKVMIDLWKHECSRVFADRLVSLDDQKWYYEAMKDVVTNTFGEEIASEHKEPQYFVNFLRDDVIEDDEIVEYAPQIYEAAPPFEGIRERCQHFLDKYNAQDKVKDMNLVLFDDAVKHLMRISRILNLPGGHCLFVGVGGSGRQSLTALACYISRIHLYRLELTRTYKTADFLEDFKECCTIAGKEGRQCCLLLTDSDFIYEDFLEYVNMMLATGYIAGLLTKEERDLMAAELRPVAKKELPNFQDTHEELVSFLLKRIRDNLHIVLAFSPANHKFAERARKFPSIISGVTIDWFLRWPSDALESVSKKFIKLDTSFELQGTEEVQTSITGHIARVHDIVVNACEEYFQKYRRHVYVTPKSYLSFIQLYKSIYNKFYKEINRKADNIKEGLHKIDKASKDVEQMKKDLAVKKVNVKKAQEDTKQVLKDCERFSAEAEVQKAEAKAIEADCLQTKADIAKSKEAASEKLAAATPALVRARAAAKSLNAGDLTIIQKLPKPADLIKRIMDCVLILEQKRLSPVTVDTISVNKQERKWISQSWRISLSEMSQNGFVASLTSFAANEKNKINEETMELLTPYLEVEDFNAEKAKFAAGAAEGLCKFVRAMYDYHIADLIAAPLRAQFAVQEQQLADAEKMLAKARASCKAAEDKVEDLQRKFNEATAKKQQLEDDAQMCEDKMVAATNLITSLSGERVRWGEDAKTFDISIQRLVGDCALSSAFISYCAPFNQEFRRKLVNDYFYNDCVERNIPVTPDINVTEFLTNQKQIAEWNSQKLPKDELSIQNGIMVTEASRWPLIMDPQGQAEIWLKNREKKNFPHFGTVSITDKRLRDNLKFAMQEGKTLIVEDVEEELDPMLDPVLDKNFYKQGRTLYVKLGDEDAEYNPNFKMFFITKLGNPHFSPELSAKTTVVNFTVTQKGLEDQLLSRVISQEQASLEEMRTKLLEELNENTISLLDLDQKLLNKLGESEGDLLEDVELIQTLNETKKQSTSVKSKIESAKQTEININKKREQYRAVATRGAVLYFVILDMSLVNWMYQTSLDQYLKWFMTSLADAKPSNMVAKRVENILKYLTFYVYDNSDRILFGNDKLTFKLMTSLRIWLTAGVISQDEIGMLLKCGSIISAAETPKNPFSWLGDLSWRNAIALIKNIEIFADLRAIIQGNEKEWKKWYDDETPEDNDIPILEERLVSQENGAFMRMLLIRALRDDRGNVAANKFVGSVMGPDFVVPLTVTMDEIWENGEMQTPTILMLTPGADPTAVLQDLAQRKGLEISMVSMGEGQEVYATKAIEESMQHGGWALLQNCHLGLGYMSDLPEMLKSYFSDEDRKINDDFRLWITCEPHNQFPISLLQISVKVAQEAPQGMKAGLLRSYRTLVNKDRLNRCERMEWPKLVYTTCLLHSVIQERRKFGPLGWNIPYEFNESDLEASLMFLEKHLLTIGSEGMISWPTVHYMICEVQYGGRITDDFDRLLFNTYGQSWLGNSNFLPNFSFSQVKGGYKYTIPISKEIPDVHQFIGTFPDDDQPELFGLHANAALIYGSTRTKNMMSTILDTQPKESSGSGGLTREDIVKQKCRTLLETLPVGYKEEFVRDKITSRPKSEAQYLPPNQDKNKKYNGFTVPLNVFLYQEVVRLGRTIDTVRWTLENLILAIDGVVIMTPDLQKALDCIYDALPPVFWYKDASGVLMSWELPTLPLWYQGLLDREKQLTEWLDNGRPCVYWMTGFFNPQGFLTAMKQEVTRKHKADRWALDDVVVKTIIEDFKVSQPPACGGVYVRGLFLEGASWDPKQKKIMECKPKEITCPMPIMKITAVLKKNNPEKEGPKAPYSCPCYKIPRRTDLNYIFNVKLNSKQPASHWVLRGVALLCSVDR